MLTTRKPEVRELRERLAFLEGFSEEYTKDMPEVTAIRVEIERICRRLRYLREQQTELI